MSFNDLFTFQLLHFGKFAVTVSDLVIVFAVFFLTLLGLRLIRKFFDSRVKAKKIDHGSAYSIYNIIRYLIWIIYILVALQILGVNLNIMLAGSAALLVGLGFGIQHIFNDLISGIILLVEGNLKVGDIVEIEDDLIGRVTLIGLRTSKIKTRDDITMIVPNSKLINDRVINWSNEQSSTRFFVQVGVGYGSDVDLVTKLLVQCAEENTAILKTPEAFVRFKDFGESSLDFQLIFWTEESFRSEFIKSQLRYAIDRKFRENKIQIPFPQRDVHIISRADKAG